MSAFIQRVSKIKIIISIVIGMMISSFGLPGLSNSIAPDLLALIILYWAMLGGDSRLSLSTVFILGLIVDFLSGSIVGAHVLKYLLLVAVAVQFGNRFRMSARLNRTGFVVATVVILELILQILVSLYIDISMNVNHLVVVAVWGITWAAVEFILQKNYSRVNK
ncbi:rod shape-determining protein MreD [Burkholderiales bacterium]|nr:rod shape-determining protein MreD [Burkholderiales bacterium]